jgi:molybdopterin converting factor small subunit
MESSSQIQNRSDGTQRGDDTGSETTDGAATQVTTVEVKCTGHVRTEIGEGRLDFTFEGTTLREFLDSFFEEYDVAEMLIAETESEATTEGWAPEMEELPGDNYAKNPEGEQTRCYARVVVNGTFNEHLDGLDTTLQDDDCIALIYPFIYCC